MATEQILSLLIAERDKLSKAIEALSGPMKRRGRPPKSAAAAESNGTSETPKRKWQFSDAQRKAAAERMRKMWAAKRAAQKKAAKG